MTPPADKATAGRKLLLLALLLGGCSSATAPAVSPAFVLRDVPSRSDATNQNMHAYSIEGHGKICYVAEFGIAKVLLWCEQEKP